MEWHILRDGVSRDGMGRGRARDWGTGMGGTDGLMEQDTEWVGCCEMEWDEMEQGAAGWNGVKQNGVGWNRQQWNGTGWDQVGWDGTIRDEAGWDRTG